MVDTDTKVLELQQRIERMKENIGPKPIMTPKTNHVLELIIGQNPINLNVQPIGSLCVIADHLTRAQEFANTLGAGDISFNGGYPVNDYIYDIKQIIATKMHASKMTDLKAMESKLNALLSSKKKAEMELEAIERLLNDQ